MFVLGIDAIWTSAGVDSPVSGMRYGGKIHRPGRSRRLLLAALLLSLGVMLSLTGSAQAGDWMQNSCENPSGTPASNQGWQVEEAGTSYSGAVLTCEPGTPMYAYLYPGTPVNTFEDVEYQPPAGSTLAGGTLQVSGYVGGYGSGSDGIGASVFSPAAVYPQDDIFAGCTSTCVSNGDNFSSTVTLPNNQGGYVDFQVDCGGQASSSCDEGANSAGYEGQFRLSAAQLLLSNRSVPAGSGFSGTLLDPPASGSADLLFTATDPSGPGVYQVTADIDGTQIYQATPDTENGECVPQGDDPATGALEFDYAQPCPQTVAVNIPVDTTQLSNGTHHLAVQVTDAAGNNATVEDTTITVNNASTTGTGSGTTTVKPVITPVPKAGRTPQVRVKFVTTPAYTGADTQLLDFSHTALPQDCTLKLTDAGPGHPKLKDSHALGAIRIKALLTALSKLSFRATDTLTFTVSAPNERAQVIRITFRDHKNPTFKLL